MLSVLGWWLAVTLMGWTVFPIAFRLFNRLPGRGYALSKALGLLLVGYVLWLLASFGILSNSWGGIVLAWLLVLIVAVLLYVRSDEARGALARFVRERWRYIATAEVLFAVALVGWAIFRSFDPDLVGTEKPMEFAFLNAILRSETFPPHDPWLSGYAISYYYFGYVIIAMLTRLVGTPAAVAFNIGNALLFALTLVGAFGVVYELIRWKSEKAPEGQSIGFALFGPLFVGLVGNLEGLLEVLHSRGFGSTAFWKWVQIHELAQAPVTGSWIPPDHWWWWRASRVVYDTNVLGQYSQIIDEFPYFSFILGDMHPHVLALPFVMLAIAVAVQTVRWAAEQKSLVLPKKNAAGAWLKAWLAEDWGRTLLVALCLGGLGFLNLWDFPVYWGLATLCYAAGRYRAAGSANTAFWLDVTLWAGRALLLGVLLFLPFYLGFGSQAGGIGLVLINKTRPWHYFVMFGLFLVTSAAFTVCVTSGWLREQRFAWTNDTKVVGAATGLLVLLSAFTGKLTALGVALLAAFLALAATRWLAFMVQRNRKTDEARLSDVAVSVMVAVGFLVTFVVEFVFIKDYFGTRTNTVFKFYYQAWVLLGLGGAYALWAVFGRGERSPGRWAAAGRGIFATAFTLTLAASLVYTIAAGYTKANGFQGEATLDCLAFVRRYNAPEYEAVKWLDDHVEGAPVVLEATGGSYTEFGRVSARTGLPTVLGWDFHEQQWRGAKNPAGSRATDIELMYRAPDNPESLTLLRTYGIQYIYVGGLERTKYELSDATINRWDNIAERVYDRDGIRIYRYWPEQEP